MTRYLFNGWGLTGEELFGIHRFLSEILRELDKLPAAKDMALVVPAGGDLPLSLQAIAVLRLGSSERSYGKRQWNKAILPRVVNADDVVVDLTLGFPRAQRTVTCLHDCIVERYPENAYTLRNKVGRLLYMGEARRAIRNSALMLTVSMAARDDLCALYGCSPRDITVVSEGWQHFERVRQDDSICERLGVTTSDYYLALGSRYAHKNFKWVVCAAQQNPTRTFVVVGSRSLSKSDRHLEDHAPSNVIFTGYLTDGEIKSLMAHCTAYVQPSLCEGFGIPPLEALSVGAHCIVSDIPVFHEVYGDSVTYLDPLDYENIDFDRYLSRVPDERARRDVLSRHSWKRSAQMLYDALSALE